MFSYTEKFDHAKMTPENLVVTEEEIAEAYREVRAKASGSHPQIAGAHPGFSLRQRQNSWFDSNEKGIILGQKVTPLDKVGVYVPGGKAVYPSSVLMNVVPAKVAGFPTST